MPQEVATVMSLPQAHAGIKEMDLYGLEWGSEYRRHGSTELAEVGRQALKAFLEEGMREDVDRYLEELSARGRADRRNGSYSRHLLTELGDIELKVPRTRRYSPVRVVRAYARRAGHIDRMILACFVLGVSTRKVAEVLLPVLGERVLILDGVALARKTGAGVLRRPVLVALGLRPDGRKEIIDFRLAPGESQTSARLRRAQSSRSVEPNAWEAFLNDLYQRGLRGRNLDLVVSDGGQGLRAALPLVYPQVPRQRCWAHKIRNILNKVREKDRKKIKGRLHQIMKAKNRTAARKAARRFAQEWEETYPEAVKSLRDDLDELLSFFHFQDQDWRKAARTTKAIERRFRVDAAKGFARLGEASGGARVRRREVRRRTRPMGVFSDKTSMERILFAVFTYENKQQGISTPFPLTQNS